MRDRTPRNLTECRILYRQWLCTLQYLTGRKDAALKSAQQAGHDAMTIEDPARSLYWQADCLHGLGRIMHPDEGKDLLLQATDYFTQLGMPVDAAASRVAITYVELDELKDMSKLIGPGFQPDMSDELAELVRAHRIFREHDNLMRRTLNLSYIVTALRLAGRYDDARRVASAIDKVADRSKSFWYTLASVNSKRMLVGMPES
jgi:hypothetical protein